MRRVSRENWDREKRNTNYVVAALMILLAGIVGCGIVSAFYLLLAILSLL